MHGPEDSWFTPSAVIIDRCTYVRESFQCCFPSLNVVGTFDTVEGFLDLGISCDVVVIDVGRQGADDDTLTGAAAVEALTAAHHQVAVFSTESRVLVLARCLAAGASGLVSKFDSLDVSGEAFVRVAQGGVAIASSLEGVRDLISRRGAPPALTVRQRQVLQARARGESWQGLAERLGISAKTAYDRLESVRAKLTWFLQDAGLNSDASPADIEYVLGLAPGDRAVHTRAPGSTDERKRSA